MTDALQSIGSIITDKDAYRDAIHLAVLPVVAKVTLSPGESVGINGDKMKPIGVVDPFLRLQVQPGEKFWLCIYPRTVTSLRHVWGHPGVPPEGYGRVSVDYKEVEKKAISKKWIEDYAAQIGLAYSVLMEGAEDSITHGDCINLGDRQENTDPDFWTHYETVTGTTIDPDKKENFFTCSC